MYIPSIVADIEILATGFSRKNWHRELQNAKDVGRFKLNVASE